MTWSVQLLEYFRQYLIRYGYFDAILLTQISRAHLTLSSILLKFMN